MRRLLIIFMLFLLPLQVSWGAIATYCKHETGAAAQHIGHHEHQHHAQEDEQKQDGPTFKFDGDCGFCQFGGIGMMTMPSVEVAKTVPDAIQAVHTPDFLSSYRLDRPERPKWARAA